MSCNDTSYNTRKRFAEKPIVAFTNSTVFILDSSRPVMLAQHRFVPPVQGSNYFSKIDKKSVLIIPDFD